LVAFHTDMENAFEHPNNMSQNVSSIL